MNEGLFRWGVLSSAKIAREQVLPALADAENGRLVAIASRDAGKARALADRFGAPHAFDSYEALLESPEIDGVYIPLPTSQHVEWAVKAARAGKHVLVEKPLALRADDIAEVIAARGETGMHIAEAFMVVHHPQWHKVRELVRSGAIGRLRQVQGAFAYRLLDPANMRNIPELGGGGLPDIGVYPTVSTRFVTGEEPRRVSASVERDPTFGTDRHASVRADFGSFELSFYCSTQMALRQVMAFHGETGLIEVPAPFNAGDYGHARVMLSSVDHAETQTFRFAGVRQYKLQAEAFVREARGEVDPAFPLEQSVLNQRVIDATFRSGEQDAGWVAV